MRVLITRFPYESQLSGEEWHTITLAEALRKRGHFLCFAGSCSILLRELAHRNFLCTRRWGGRAAVSKSTLLIFCLLWPIIFCNYALILAAGRWRNRIDTVYMLSLNEKILMTPWALIMGLKVIWVEHARIGSWLRDNPLLFFYRLWAPRVTIIAVSQRQKNDLPVKNGFAVMNGVDTDFFSPAQAKSREEKTLVGAVARLAKDKGLDVLLRAGAPLLQKGLIDQLLIVGAGSELENLRRLAEKLGIERKTIFLGEKSREEMPEFYRRLKVFVLPSNKEDPFGLAAAEAMACGKPVIVTTICGIADKLSAGREAEIIHPNDVNALREALLKLLTDATKRERLAENGRRFCRSHFSLSGMVTEYEKLMQAT